MWIAANARTVSLFVSDDPPDSFLITSQHVVRFHLLDRGHRFRTQSAGRFPVREKVGGYVNYLTLRQRVRVFGGD
jgi:hypothetical protein